MKELLAKFLKPLQRQVNGMVRRVVLTQLDDTPGRQTLQLLDGSGPNGNDLLDGVEHFQPFGIRGLPPLGVDAIGFAVGGWRNHLVAIAASAKVKPTPALVPGDVCYLGVDPDNYTLLQANGKYTAQGNVGWFATLKGLSEKQFISMVPGTTVIFVSNGAVSSTITITPGEVNIQTPSFVHP